MATTVLAGVFLVHQLLAWPPHEDETLALFVGRDSIGGVIDHVTRDRGGAPLHFVFAWLVAHLGLGLAGLRLVSVAFALGSLPLVALLGKRLAGRAVGLLATVIVATDWAFLFHGIYARMYSLFLFLSALSLLALLRALDRSTWTRWGVWGLAMLATIAAHPYGALVLGAQGLFVLLARRDRLRAALLAFTALAIAATPFWLTDLVLADRFDAGVQGSGKLGGPFSVASYLWHTAGDFTTGWLVLQLGVVALVVLGAWHAKRELRLLAVAVVGFPTLAFLAARFGGSGAPESRHLIFALPVLAVIAGLGIAAVAERSLRAGAVVGAALVAAQLGWAWHRTPALFDWEPSARQAARASASAWLAATSRPDDVLFAYNPLFLQAWERERSFPATVIPRADPKLALRALERLPRPLGRGVWILDASDPNDLDGSLEIRLVRPRPAAAFEVRRFGPFLVIRSRGATLTPARFLRRSAEVTAVGLALELSDAELNSHTIDAATKALRR